MREKNKLIIAGSRTLNNYALFKREVNIFMFEHNLNRGNCTIVSGHAKGADIYGEYFARQGYFSLLTFPANWSLYGKAAGMIRNNQMADIATHCLLFWDGKSHGTKNMIEIAKRHNLIYKIIEI